MAKKQRLPIASTSNAIAPSKPTRADHDRELRWRAEDALRVCETYEKNKSDKTLMGAVKKLAREKVNDLKRVIK